MYRPLSLEIGPPHRPLHFEMGICYYHAESTFRDMNLEFWANANDLKFVGTFLEEVHLANGRRGAIFKLPTADHFIEYTPGTCFMPGPM